jgi:RNA polymerase sigma-70 factor (ECF subfamily)
MISRITSVSPVDRDRGANHTVQHPSEAHLLAQAKRGRADAFETLCRPNLMKLYNAAFRITQNREDAEDAVQDSLMRAFLRISDFRGASAFSTWLTRIVINSALMIRRKNRSGQYVVIEDISETANDWSKVQIDQSSPNPEQTYVARERREALCKAISRLRPLVRAVVETGQLQEFSIKETAEVLNISIAAAKGRLFHARAALRRSAALRAIVQSRTAPAA